MAQSGVRECQNEWEGEWGIHRSPIVDRLRAWM